MRVSLGGAVAAERPLGVGQHPAAQLADMGLRVHRVAEGVDAVARHAVGDYRAADESRAAGVDLAAAGLVRDVDGRRPRVAGEPLLGAAGTAEFIRTGVVRDPGPVPLLDVESVERAAGVGVMPGPPTRDG